VTKCRCKEVLLVEGADVEPYVEHLREVRVDVAKWEVFYECPITGALWVKTYPESEAHGGGSPYLIRK